MAPGGAALAQFVSKGHDLFASLSGKVTIDNNSDMIDKPWSKQAEAWFHGGKTDSNLALLRFDIADAEIWETDLSLSGKLKMISAERSNRVTRAATLKSARRPGAN